MSTGSVINAQQRLALVERIACLTVGIAANDNTCVGTGTLVAIDEYHLVITAEHVIKNADVQNIRFWCRPTAPIIEKAAKNLSPSEVGRLTAGEKFPIETIITDPSADLAAIKISSDSQLPEPRVVASHRRLDGNLHPTPGLTSGAVMCRSYRSWIRGGYGLIASREALCRPRIGQACSSVRTRSLRRLGWLRRFAPTAVG